MNTTEIFASNMRQRRISLGLTQKKLAELIGYSEKSVSKWETGEAIPPSVLLPKLAEALSISIDELFDNGAEPAYFLGIDGGGTKTEFMLTDKDGVLINRTILGASNPVDVGLTGTFEILEEGISDVCGGVFLSKVSVFAGIAGGITGDNKQKISAFLQKFGFCRQDNDSDAKNAVSASLDEADGITVILGTGDIAYTQKDKSCYRTGGFGYLFDTGGSGYSIGRDAILFGLNTEQTGKTDSVLYKMLKGSYEKDKLLDSLSDIYNGGKRHIASIAPLVFAALEKGDENAREILEKNFRGVAELIIDASRYLESEKIKVSLVGTIAKASIVIPTIQKYIKALDTNKEFNVSTCNTAPVVGALRLAGLKEDIKNA